MSLTAIIVRHGNTFAPGEAPRRIGLRTDIPLVASGQDQARALGAAFAGDAPFDHIFTSPLRRTRETAELIGAQQAKPPPAQPCDWLAEIDHGPDEDQPEDVVQARIGAAALTAWDAAATPPPGWTVDAEPRLQSWRALLEQASGRILIVTSNGAARFALLAHPDLREQAALLPSMKLRTGAWGCIVRDDAGLRIDAWDVRP